MSLSEADSGEPQVGERRELLPARGRSIGLTVIGVMLLAVLLRIVQVNWSKVSPEDAEGHSTVALILAVVPVVLFLLVTAFALLAGIVGLMTRSKRAIVIEAGMLKFPPGVLYGNPARFEIELGRIAAVEPISDLKGHDVQITVSEVGPVRMRPLDYGGQEPVVAFLRAALAND